MRWLLFAFVSLLSVVASLQNGGVTRGGSGIQIGTSDRSSHSKGTGLLTGRGHSGVRLGEARFPNSTRQRPFTTTTTTPPPPPSKFTLPPQSGDNRNSYNTTYLRVSANLWEFSRSLESSYLSRILIATVVDLHANWELRGKGISRCLVRCVESKRSFIETRRDRFLQKQWIRLYNVIDRSVDIYGSH